MAGLKSASLPALKLCDPGVRTRVGHLVPFVVLVCATLLSADPAFAQFSQQGPKLLGAGAIGPLVYQGQSVALSANGDTAIVGGYGDNNNVGAAFVWTRAGGLWTQQGPELIGTGATYVDRRGVFRVHFRRRQYGPRRRVWRP
jgi:hypothetical protein